MLLPKAELVNQTAIYLREALFFEPKTLGNFLREVETNVANGLALKNLLGLVELFTHELIEVVGEHEVLELGELHRHDLLLDLVQDVVRFTRVQVALHIHSLLQLRRDQQEVLIVTVTVGQELLLAKLQQISFLVENLVFVLVRYLYHLVVFFQNQLRPFDLTVTIEVGQNK